jgi:hypothetical protein
MDRPILDKPLKLNYLQLLETTVGRCKVAPCPDYLGPWSDHPLKSLMREPGGNPYGYIQIGREGIANYRLVEESLRGHGGRMRER